MDGVNSRMRTCSSCSVKKDLEQFAGNNLCCERYLERRRQHSAKKNEKVKERNKRYKEENEEQINA